MGRFRLLSLVGVFCLALPLFVVTLTSANVTLSVNESQVRLSFNKDQVQVALPVQSSLAERVSTRISIELLDPDDTVRATIERTENINRGLNTLTLPLTFIKKDDSSLKSEDLVWYRLRYRLQPTGPTNFDPITGMLALHGIAPDLFLLRVSVAEFARAGANYRIRVRSEHPLTGNPVTNVEISASLRFESDKFSQNQITNDNGEVSFDFKIPKQLEIDEGDLKIIGIKGGLVREIESEVDLARHASGAVSTDKPLYQPGQKLHVRALFFDPARHAIPNEVVYVKIISPVGETVFRSTVTTSRFGIASADWEIPESTRLGDYSIRVSLDDSNYDDIEYSTEVKISRYDLPNFNVEVKPDRRYYTAGQDAEIIVHADYLFGEPVKRGHVRIVRELERNWNYREQKYETKEGETYEGDLDAKGQFAARITLEKDHQELAERDYSRFEDLTFAAYVTDPTTNRTEQRRFDLRLTKQAIHLYVIDQGWQNHGHPLQFVISTSYADGTPAECDVRISEKANAAIGTDQVLRTVRTNRYGLAKVTNLRQSSGADDQDREALEFIARDTKGNTGTHTEDFYFRTTPVVRVETDKIIYRQGEPVRVQVSSSQKDMRLIVEAVQDSNVVKSETVQLVDGKGTVTLPYQPELKDAVVIAAYSASEFGDDYYEFPFGRQTIIYPRNRDLNLQVALNRATYRPGEEANIDFITSSAEGKLLESALGVVIFDKAVEQRAMTDRDFSGSFGFYSAYARVNGEDVGPGGITRHDIERLDLRKPLPEGIELAAEILLNNLYYRPKVLSSDSFERNPFRVFNKLIDAQLEPLKIVLEDRYKKQALYPTNEASLRRLLLEAGVELDQLRDPWQQRYRPSFTTEGDSNVLLLESSGIDELFNTTDDFTALRLSWPYFRFTGEAINRAVANYHARTGQYIRDQLSLQKELLREGIDLDNLRDPWNQPYQFEFHINRTNFTLIAVSGGPDRTYLPVDDRDRVEVWKSEIDYSLETRLQVEAALAKYFNEANVFPQTDLELTTALKSSNIDRAQLRDPWGNRLYATFSVESYFRDKARIVTQAKLGDKPEQKTEITPVTSTLKSVRLRSNGPDGREGTYDDFDIGRFWRITSELDRTEKKVTTISGPPLRSGTGAITGKVIDVNGAVVPNATVTAKHIITSSEYEATTNDEGVFLIKNLPTGMYEVRFDVAGFKRTVINDVMVRSLSIVEVSAEMSPGGVSEAVTVTGNSTFTSTSLSVATLRSKEVSFARANTIQTSTPRLREYFPETLVWQPSLETDARGRARLKFKFADNITTWKLSVLGSTADGQIGTVEKEIRSFQPFFVELDPPRILTEGDHISLPVVVRNYLERQQPVQLEIKPETWFAINEPSHKRIDVPAGDARTGTFDIRAIASVTDGKQRVTALGSDDNDAIEKPVTVHPDGQELTATASDIVLDRSSLEFSIANETIPGSAKAELKIYPNLLAHVIESVEAIMSRPYGCGEQTISSTYPSLLLLLHHQRTGLDFSERRRAERYLNLGYARLLNYNHASGGFSYWSKGEPDLALTAYALRFLLDANKIIDVDETVITRARDWLLKQQAADGSWPSRSYYNSDKRQSTMLTAYVARILAAGDREAAQKAGNDKQPSNIALQRALQYLNARAKEIDEPYVLAAFTLAAIDSGSATEAEWAKTKLVSLARDEGNGSYWSLETNTPFYGWGQAGRVETTALVLQALSRRMPADAASTILTPPNTNSPSKNIDKASPPADQTTEQQLLRSGLLFLLKQKDRYGVWYSTQATINVLHAILEQVPTHGSQSGVTSNASVIVNGRAVQPISLPPANKLVGPILVDVSRHLNAGRNFVEIQRSGNTSSASAQVVANYYVPWDSAINPAKTEGLRLESDFDKTTGKVGDWITCRVKAERVAFKGYGMLLAEIGLPPGADVDRASLDEAVTNSNWSINQYDVLPDRVVFYLWPRADGISFNFKFRPRFGLNAKTAASTVYDYYNPEAKTTVRPATFLVK